MLKRLELLFVFSPCLWSWAVVFNLPDSKHVLSRLIAIICIYCLFRFRCEWKNNFQCKNTRYFIYLLYCFVSYYTFLHFFREGHFDYARVMIAVAAFFTFVPVRLFSLLNLNILLTVSSYAMFIVAIYQYEILSIRRVGYVVNSGPYAMVVGLLIVIQLTLVNTLKWRVILGFNSIILFFCLIHSQTRGAWIAVLISIILFSIIYFILNASKKRTVLLLAILTSIGYSYSYLSSSNSAEYRIVKHRVTKLYQEINMPIEHHINTSTGIRFDLWKSGLSTFLESPIIGVNYTRELEVVKELERNNEISEKAYRVLDHKKPSYHNVYIQALVKGGIVAFILILVLNLSLVIFSNKSRVFQSTIPVTLYVFISFQTESHLTIYNQVAYFWVLLMGYTIFLDSKLTNSDSPSV